MTRLMYVLCTLTCAAFALAGWSFYNGHRNACESRDAALNVTRDILLLTQQTNASRPLPADARARANQFYAYAFARIEAARC